MRQDCYGHSNMPLTTMSRWWPRLVFHHAVCGWCEPGWAYVPPRVMRSWHRTWFEPMRHPDANLVWACVPSTWTRWAEMSMSFMRQLSHHTSSFTGRLCKPGIVFLQTCIRPWHRLSTDVCNTMANVFLQTLASILLTSSPIWLNWMSFFTIDDQWNLLI
jgi:hypothetical protein